MEFRLWDAHCHIGWFADPVTVAREAAKIGLGMLGVTVVPREFLAIRPALRDEKNVMLAAGLHPWWVQGAADCDELLDAISGLRFIGEIGLDASPKHLESWGAQLAAFERICAACADASDGTEPKVLSIHAVRSTSTVLDVLERTSAAERCRCVLHWFSGSSEELWRAVDLGCLFSLGERSLATRRGREYARILPADRLLTETDLPEHEASPATASDIASSLERTVSAIAAARGISADEVRHLVASNSEALLAQSVHNPPAPSW